MKQCSKFLEQTSTILQRPVLAFGRILGPSAARNCVVDPSVNLRRCWPKKTASHKQVMSDTWKKRTAKPMWPKPRQVDVGAISAGAVLPTKPASMSYCLWPVASHAQSGAQQRPPDTGLVQMGHLLGGHFAQQGWQHRTSAGGSLY